MNDREKILAAAVAALVALWGTSQGWDKYQAALEKNRNTQSNVAQQLSTARTATARGRRAQQKLSLWRRQSLPTDPDIAKSLYQDWLRQELTTAGLKVKELSILPKRGRSKHYQEFSFQVLAEGKLEQFTHFLHQFYQARHLHRISKANMSSTSENRKTLKISLTVDGLLLEDADRKNQLASGTNETFTQPLKHFQTSIVDRNLFAAYKPPQAKAVAKVEKDEDTEAAQAKFSGINYGQEGWLMSVAMQKSGKVFYFREGDTIKIGQFKGTLERLDGKRRRAVISSGSGRVQVQLGQTLAEAEPLGESAS